MKTPLPKLKSTLGPNRPILETTLSSFLSSWCGKFTPFQLLLSKSKVSRATLLESANTTRRDPRLVRDTISKRHIHSESLGAVIAYHLSLVLNPRENWNRGGFREWHFLRSHWSTPFSEGVSRSFDSADPGEERGKGNGRKEKRRGKEEGFSRGWRGGEPSSKQRRKWSK